MIKIIIYKIGARRSVYAPSTDTFSTLETLPIKQETVILGRLSLRLFAYIGERSTGISAGQPVVERPLKPPSLMRLARVKAGQNMPFDMTLWNGKYSL